MWTASYGSANRRKKTVVWESFKRKRRENFGENLRHFFSQKSSEFCQQIFGKFSTYFNKSLGKNQKTCLNKICEECPRKTFVKYLVNFRKIFVFTRNNCSLTGSVHALPWFTRLGLHTQLLQMRTGKLSAWHPVGEKIIKNRIRGLYVGLRSP